MQKKHLNHSWLESSTLIMGIIGQASLYLQAYKIFHLQSAYAVSAISSLISLISIVFWLLYGYARNIKPLIVCNLVGILGSMLVVLGIILYR